MAKDLNGLVTRAKRRQNVSTSSTCDVIVKVQGIKDNEHLWGLAGNGARCTKCGRWEPLSLHPSIKVRWTK